MKLFLTKRQDGSFMPSYPSDHDKAKRFKVDQEVEVTARKARNPQFHRKFFALLNMTFENQEHFDNPEDLRAWVIMKSGYYNIVPAPNGQPIYLPKSIAFDQMDEFEFSELYSKALDVIGQFLGVQNKEIEREIVNFY